MDDSILTDWPEWIKAAGAETPTALATISEICARIRESVKDGYSYDHVSQAEYNSVTDKMIKDGLISADGRVLNNNATLSKQFSAVILYQNSAAYNMLGLLISSKKIAIVHLIEATKSAIELGNLLVALICLRSVVENISHLDFGVTQLKSYSIPSKHDVANNILAEIKGKVVDMTYSTRVDWEQIVAGETENLIKRNKIDYKPNELRQDRTAGSILKSIDCLNKKIKGVRAVYEILCEFAHPNVGLTMALTRSTTPFPDKHGFTWIRKEVSLQPPVAAVGGTGRVMSQILNCIAQCMQHFETLINEAEEQRSKIQQISQVLLRHTLMRNKALLDPYAMCPCGSGTKIKFCCGATTH